MIRDPAIILHERRKENDMSSKIKNFMGEGEKSMLSNVCMYIYFYCY